MKRRGLVCFFLGGLCITAALCLTLWNWLESARAGASSAQVVTQLSAQIATTEPVPTQSEGPVSTSEPVYAVAPTEPVLPDYVVNPEMPMPVQTVDGVDYVGILSIPALELELPVVSTWSMSLLEAAPCRYSGSAYLHDLVICAHNYSSHFGSLKNLGMGDAVTFTDVDGNVFFYEVADMETLLPSDTLEMTDSEWDLTLFTCTYGGRTRVTVRCVLIETT